MNVFEMELSDGTIVLVEACEVQSGIDTDRSIKVGRGNVFNKAKTNINDALKVIRPIGESVIDKMNNFSIMPAETVIDFGIKISVSGEIVIASASSEANFKISLKWKS